MSDSPKTDSGNPTRARFPVGFMRKVITAAIVRGDSLEQTKKAFGEDFDLKVWNEISAKVHHFEEWNPLFRHETGKHFGVYIEKDDMEFDR